MESTASTRAAQTSTAPHAIAKPEVQASKGRQAFSVASILSGQLSLDSAWDRAVAFVMIVAQCACLYLVIHRFKIETDLFRLMMAVALVGFIAHHLLPQRFRLAFFVSLSIGLVVYCVGLDRGQWNPWNSLRNGGSILGIGLCLIGMCRLPVRFNFRVALLLGCAGVLAALRAKWVPISALDAVWPILGAMFMYRLAVYVYDLEHENKRSSWLQACSYFFLFPNVWLFVFPLIDFKTFLKTYYDEPAARIYQRGVEWMMRGVIHLLLWRLVYYQFYIDPARISNGTDLVQFLVSNVALYLRVSGQFHFAIGLLHMFGFNLPETNRRYFLASSFVDYWRRANIYMKDFLMKLCYYPLVVRFKKLGTVWSVVAAISCTFVLTWFLHPYQWFWVRGSFQNSAKDVVFWSLLGVAVILNSVRDLTSKTKTASKGSVWRLAFKDAASTGFTFIIVTVLWSIWTCDSLSQWAGIWTKADWSTAALGASTVVILMLAKILFESPVGFGKLKPKIGLKRSENIISFRPGAYAVVLPALLLAVGSMDRIMAMLPAGAKAVARSMFSNTPNKSGEEFLVRGYYEGLMDVARVSPMLEGALTTQPATWQLLEQTAAVRVTADLRTRELVPGVTLTINNVPFQTNRWGIRDGDYDRDKAPGVKRVALLGSSITMGWNVAKGDTFEAILEKEINAAYSDHRTEVWNFAVNGYSIVSLVELLDKKVLAYKPDMVMVVSHPEDPSRAVFMLAKSIALGARPDYPFIQELMAKENLNSSTPRQRIESKLAPYAKQLTQWSYQTIAARCRELGIKPVLVYLPGVLQETIGQLDRDLTTSALEEGFDVVPLLDVYGQVNDRSTLMVAAWDAHPNTTGHRLVAKSLLRGLEQQSLLPVHRISDR